MENLIQRDDTRFFFCALNYDFSRFIFRRLNEFSFFVSAEKLSLLGFMTQNNLSVKRENYENLLL